MTFTVFGTKIIIEKETKISFVNIGDNNYSLLTESQVFKLLKEFRKIYQLVGRDSRRMGKISMIKAIREVSKTLYKNPITLKQAKDIVEAHFDFEFEQFLETCFYCDAPAHIKKYSKENNDFYFRVECENGCSITREHDSSSEAIEEWNSKGGKI